MIFHVPVNEYNSRGKILYPLSAQKKPNSGFVAVKGLDSSY